MIITRLLVGCVLSMMWDSAISQPHNLIFMLIISYGQYGYNSSGALPAADMALEDISSDPNILTEYNLMYDKVRDSMVRQQTILSNNNIVQYTDAASYMMVF